MGRHAAALRAVGVAVPSSRESDDFWKHPDSGVTDPGCSDMWVNGMWSKWHVYIYQNRHLAMFLGRFILQQAGSFTGMDIRSCPLPVGMKAMSEGGEVGVCGRHP